MWRYQEDKDENIEQNMLRNKILKRNLLALTQILNKLHTESEISDAVGKL